MVARKLGDSWAWFLILEIPYLEQNTAGRLPATRLPAAPKVYYSTVRLSLWKRTQRHSMTLSALHSRWKVVRNVGWDLADLKRGEDRRGDLGSENEETQGSDLQHGLTRRLFVKVGFMKMGVEVFGRYNRPSWNLQG